MYTFESSSGICDKNGNLLFYTNGDTVYNRKHQPMKNGVFLPFYQINSAVMGSMVLPVPGSDHLYYLFNCPAGEFQSVNKFVRYSIIDMDGDNGYGEVTVSRQPILSHPTEGVAYALHANQKDYWIGCADRFSNTFNCVRTVNETVDTQKVQNNSKNIPFFQANIFCRFSPSSKILAGMHSVNSVTGKYWLNLHKFDNATGIISDRILIPQNPSLYFGEFSPRSRYLYINERLANSVVIKQYDLSVWDSASIANSLTIVGTISIISAGSITGMQLGPDGKIYVFHNKTDSLSVINNPDLPGLACDFKHYAISLAGRDIMLGGPYYPNFVFRKGLDREISFCEGDSAVLDTRYPAGTKIKWSTGDTGPAIIVRTPGIYSVNIQHGNIFFNDTVQVKVKKPFTVFLGSDTAFCGQFQHLLDAGAGAKKYLWNTGDTTVTKLVNKPGIYAVTVKDSNSCDNGDTVDIAQINLPGIIKDISTCDYVTLSIPPQGNGVKYKWDNGDTALSIKVFKTGKRSITISNKFCTITDTAYIDMLPKPGVNIGADTNICDMQFITLNVSDSGEYIWNTGETSSSITVSKPGTYRVTVTRNGCMASDSINLFCDTWYYIPSAFTPNNDGMNSSFGVIGEDIRALTMKIFSRWGELLYEGTGINSQWDGTYKGTQCPEGAYMYSISVKGMRRGRLIIETFSGSVTLLR